MFNYLLFPKVITKEEFDLNKNDFLEYSIVEKSKASYSLVQTEYIKDEFWLSTSFVKTIYNLYGNTLFVIVDEVEDGFEIFYGYSIENELNSLNYQTKEHVKFNDFEIFLKNIKSKFYMIQSLYSQSNKILIFDLNNNDIIIQEFKKIFPNHEIEKKDFSEILKSSKSIKSIKKRTVPYIVVLGISFVVYVAGNMMLSSYYTNIVERNKEQEKKYTQQKNILVKEVKQLRKKIDSISISQKKLIELKDKIYKGDSYD